MGKGTGIMVGWLKALLFVAGGTIAAAGTAYVTGLLDPFLDRNPPVIAALPEPDAPQPAQQEQPQAPSASDEPAAETDEAAVSDKQDRLVRPSFDVLRVEPDGSLLIAGKAAADAMVDVLNGDTVLGSAGAGPEGDFVVVLDDPLAPGDYQLSLRSISGDIVIQSEESAVVSVPETPDGEVLALVDPPGAPAELITVPDASAAPAAEGDTQVAAAPAAPEPATEEEDAAAEPAVEGQDAAADDAVPSQPADSEVRAATEQPAEEETATAQPDEQETPGEPAAPADQPAVAPETADAAPEQDVAAEDEALAENESAALSEEEEPSAEQQQDVPIAYRVVVEAVEIEGGTIYVAGQAIPGRVVRVYADETLLGQSMVSEGGRFLVEARHDLPVGNYMIRADLLEADGSVVARAAVPFEREPGEAIAAVAPQVEQQPAETPAPSADAPEQAAVAEGESSEVAAAPALQRVDRGVIIRRGDSLWRISRRVYGRGVRYSTIYLANQDQIRNPDMIWPGQVFSVPETTPEGELADLDAIADQVVDPDADTAQQ